MAREKTATVLETELYERLSKITGHGKDVVRDVLKSLHEFVIDELKNGTPVRIGPLGEITTITCRRCGGYNFKTGESKPFKMVKQVKFKPSISLKRSVKNGDI